MGWFAVRNQAAQQVAQLGMSFGVWPAASSASSSQSCYMLPDLGNHSQNGTIVDRSPLRDEALYLAGQACGLHSPRGRGSHNGRGRLAA
ncbi:hypothetical protein UF78_15245 [Stutzerimonas stutzeri]|uniref:Uncharacterized protein n=1 Tax=Stutzerimonas stutzeri TaxID=316 RepID=A0A0D9AHH4_STUST|nr:hypothetical protein UF78_15245 [Stutzerimonas stutzeri]